MPKHQTYHHHGHLEKTESITNNEKIVYPGVRAKLKQAVTIGAITLPKGMKVIIEPQEDLTKFKITPFKKDKKSARKDQPESRGSVETQTTYEIKIPANSQKKYFKFNNEYFDKVNANLFPNDDSPSLNDIKQVAIPDCSLLASIQSILTHQDGKAFIRGMMRQNPNGTTTVRLFNPETLKPEYITVTNSVIANRLGRLNHHSALWVHILEKAFAARGQKSKTYSFENVIHGTTKWIKIVSSQSPNKDIDASIASAYSNGISQNFALRVLTGLDVKASHMKHIDPTPYDIFNFVDTDQIKGLIDAQNSLDQQGAKLPESLPQKYIRTTLNLNKLEKMLPEYQAKQVIDDYTQLVLYACTNEDKYKKLLKNPNFQAIKKAKLPSGASKIFLAMLEKERPFSGYYHQHQIDFYNHLKSSLEQGKLVTTGTINKFNKKVTGLVSNHAYTILGVTEKPIIVRDKKNNERTVMIKYVKLRNPWGRLSRKYKNNSKHSAKLGLSPYSEIELSEFTKYFGQIIETVSANIKFSRDAKKEDFIHNVNMVLDDWNINTKSSLESLIIAKSRIHRCNEYLVEAELSLVKNINSDIINKIEAVIDQNKDEAQQTNEILNKIEIEHFAPIAGQKEQMKENVANLLRLHVELNRQEPNLEEIDRLKSLVKDYSTQDELWDKLITYETQLTAIVSSRASEFNKKIENILEFARATRDRFNNLHPNEGALDIAILNAEKLNRLYVEFKATTDSLKLMGYTWSQEIENEMAQIVQQVKNDAALAVEGKEKYAELKDLISKAGDVLSKLRENHEQTADEQEHYNFLIKNALRPEQRKLLEAEANKLKDSSNQNKRELGVILKSIVKVAEAIHSIFKAIRKVAEISFAPIKGLHSITLGTLGIFRRPNEYEVENNNSSTLISPRL